MQTTIYAHTKQTIGRVDPRIFGGFLEHLGRAVYEGVYDPKSKHADENGFRTDVLSSLDRLKFTAMRYPGGNFVSGYHWIDGVGPREQRPRTRDLAWQSLEPNQFGTNEFMQLSRRMNWTPMVAVNLGTGSPEEARNWLEYCNVDAGSRWADLRIEHGFKQPHDVKLWCLGNEMDGNWQIGHMPAEQYAIVAQQTATIMKMVDPQIEVVACGSCTPDLPTYLEWDRKVLEHCRNDIDYISMHRYVGNTDDDTPNYLACTRSVDEQIEATDALCRYVHKFRKTKKRVYLSFDEWNVWYRANHGEHTNGRGKFAAHLLEEVYNLEDALVVAGFLNSFIRHADCVKIANLAQIVNVIAPILTRGDDMVLQTIFYPFEIYAKRREGTSLRLVVEGPAYPTKNFGTASYVDASAIINRNQLSLFATNRSIDQMMQIDLRLAGATVTRLLHADIVCDRGGGGSADPKLANTFDQPTRIVSRPFDDVSITNEGATLRLPSLSVVAATFELAG